MNESNNSPTPTKRDAWIAKRTDELLAAGWQNPRLAMKRATREWRNQTPAHKAAVARNNAMAAARSERLNALPASDSVRRAIEVRP